jgi:hypothetical protein
MIFVNSQFLLGIASAYESQIFFLNRTNPTDDASIIATAVYLLSFIIIRIIRYMPTGQASNATILSKLLPIAANEPKVGPKKETAARTSSGAAQHAAIMSISLSVLFICPWDARGFPTASLADIAELLSFTFDSI